MTVRFWPPQVEGPPPALPRPPAWTDLARCAEVGDDLWFPEKGGSVRQAKRICMGCEVRAECLEYALENNERFGIWGAKSEPERRRILRDRATGAVAA
jgi:WhiB family transcriptional regulator, redox-sensing transcriptional regulator